MKGNILLSTQEGRTNTHVHISSRNSISTTRRHHHHHHQEIKEKYYMPEEIKKTKPHTFDGEMNKLEDS